VGEEGGEKGHIDHLSPDFRNNPEKGKTICHEKKELLKEAGNLSERKRRLRKSSKYLSRTSLSP